MVLIQEQMLLEITITNKAIEMTASEHIFISQKAYYAHPMVAAAVIIHLAADGTADIDQRQHNITVQLVDTKEQTHPLGQSHPISIKC